jgi:hypothetical protein
VLTRLTTPTTKNLTAVTGNNFSDASGNAVFDVWVGGEGGTLLHWDGQNWTELTTPAARTIEDIWSARDAPVMFVDGTPTISRYVP